MTTTQKAQRKFPLVPVLFGVVALALITVVVLTFDSGGTELGSPEVEGDFLPVLPDTGTDPALGLAAPEVTGEDFDGNPVEITNDGKAKIILFVAHWCPHCQREVPIVSEWLAGDPLPDEVDLYTVSTAISRTRDNYPPSAWLEREGWTAPVVVDDGSNTIAGAFGLPAYPYWVFLDADGSVLTRVTGGIEPASLDNAVATLAATVNS